MQGDQCSYCRHFIAFGKCRAYLGGIPADVMAGKRVHDRVLPDQIDTTVFEVEPRRSAAWNARQAQIQPK